MKYVVIRMRDDYKLTSHKLNIEGLYVLPVNRVPGLTIKAKKIAIVDNEMQNEYIKQRINRKIDKIIKYILRILNDEEDESDAGMVLDELNRLKGILINKYKEYLKVSDYKSLLTKLILIEDEFKKNYNQKIYNSYLTNYIEEELTEARGR